MCKRFRSLIKATALVIIMHLYTHVCAIRAGDALDSHSHVILSTYGDCLMHIAFKQELYRLDPKISPLPKPLKEIGEKSIFHKARNCTKTQ